MASDASPVSPFIPDALALLPFVCLFLCVVVFGCFCGLVFGLVFCLFAMGIRALNFI